MEPNLIPEESRHAIADLRDIRSMMERSTRFLSLSGWSGVWAGGIALVGALVGYYWLPADVLRDNYFATPASDGRTSAFCFCGEGFFKPLILAALIFIVALAGGLYFTWQKNKRDSKGVWNPASRQMLWAIAVPMIIGGIFVLGFMYYGDAVYTAPACLAFYGLALVNGSKYTLSDIRYLGYLELLLSALCLFIPGYGLYFWVMGFGILHILYGIIMKIKYG
jgi:hypothetical protein